MSCLRAVFSVIACLLSLAWSSGRSCTMLRAGHGDRSGIALGPFAPTKTAGRRCVLGGACGHASAMVIRGWCSSESLNLSRMPPVRRNGASARAGGLCTVTPSGQLVQECQQCRYRLAVREPKVPYPAEWSARPRKAKLPRAGPIICRCSISRLVTNCPGISTVTKIGGAACTTLYRGCRRRMAASSAELCGAARAVPLNGFARHVRPPMLVASVLRETPLRVEVMPTYIRSSVAVVEPVERGGLGDLNFCCGNCHLGRAGHIAAFRSRSLSARWAITFAHAGEQYTASLRRLRTLAAVWARLYPRWRHWLAACGISPWCASLPLSYHGAQTFRTG